MKSRPFHGDPISRIEWAYSQEHLTSAPQAVLTCLAFRDGVRCHPSQSTIAKDTKLSVRTVKRCLTYLEKEGYLARAPRYKGNQRLADEYELAYNGVIDPSSTYSDRGGDTVTPRTPDTTPGDTVSPGVVSQWPTEQEEEQEVEQEDLVTTTCSPDTSSREGVLLGPGGRASRTPGGQGGQPGAVLWVGPAGDLGMLRSLAETPEGVIIHRKFNQLSRQHAQDPRRLALLRHLVRFVEPAEPERVLFLEQVISEVT